MESKTGLFLVGLIVTSAIMVVLVLVFSRANIPEEPQATETIFSTKDLNEIKSQTGNLQNYGNLPNALTADDVGRENPFDPYK